MVYKRPVTSVTYSNGQVAVKDVIHSILQNNYEHVKAVQSLYITMYTTICVELYFYVMTRVNGRIELDTNVDLAYFKSWAYWTANNGPLKSNMMKFLHTVIRIVHCVLNATE